MRNSNENVESRRREIMRLLKKNGRLTIAELSKTFNTSELTIRRDLTYLEGKMLVERYFGGVMLSQNPPEDYPAFEEKLLVCTTEKERIAKLAVSLIQDDDVIFVNSGSTVLFLPKYISSPNVTIVTNNACMATTEGNRNVNLFITGGERQARAQSLTGDLTLHALSQINANKCILSINGISANHGITSTSYAESTVNYTMLKRCSGERIILADSSKIGRCFSFVSGKITMIDTIITNSDAPKDELAKLRSHGIKVLIAE